MKRTRRGEAQGKKIGPDQWKRVNGKEEGNQRKYSGTMQVKRTKEKGQEENKEKIIGTRHAKEQKKRT